MNNKQGIIFAITMVLLFCQICYGYIDTANDYYTNVLEPKLDILCKATMKEAEKIVSNHNPVFEIALTQEERYFSSDSMNFFTGGELQVARYSGVKKLAVWLYGRTLIKGWTRDGTTYKVNYIYTRDNHFETLSGINALGSTVALERFFNDTLYNISAEYGSVGHLQTVFANDDWAAVSILVSYSKNTIQSIEAWDDNAYGDGVPIVPKSEKIEKYIEDSKHKINWEIEYITEQNLVKTQSQNLSYGTKKTVNRDRNKNLATTEIVIISLSIGIIISLLAIIVYKELLDKSTRPIKILDSPKKEELKQEAEYIDAVFTDKASDEDFDYPYEDMKDALR